MIDQDDDNGDVRVDDVNDDGGGDDDDAVDDEEDGDENGDDDDVDDDDDNDGDDDDEDDDDDDDDDDFDYDDDDDEDDEYGRDGVKSHYCSDSIWHSPLVKPTCMPWTPGPNRSTAARMRERAPAKTHILQKSKLPYMNATYVSISSCCVAICLSCSEVAHAYGRDSAPDRSSSTFPRPPNNKSNANSKSKPTVITQQPTYSWKSQYTKSRQPEAILEFEKTSWNKILNA